MKKTVTIALITFVFLLITPIGLTADDTNSCFTRSAEIMIPEADLNTGGIGELISGVDIDGDGMTEMYIVNNMYDNNLDGAHEEIPRIYKLEWDGSDWVQVWKADAPVPAQNTWPVLLLTDLDGDGKQELTWTATNNITTEHNPVRVMVYEHEGGTSDNFGVLDGTAYMPNSTWTITDEDDANVRPMHGTTADIDGDGTMEFIFADRKGNGAGYYFGIASVDDVPDNGDGSETWTMETSGLDFALGADIQNKWAVAVIGPNAYFFDEMEISKVSWDGVAYTYTALPPLEAGSPNQSAEVVDLDGDGNMEIVTAIYDWADDTKKNIMLLQEDGSGDLTRTHLHSIADNFTSRGAWGSSSGDIDGDGNLDFVFGSRGGNDTDAAQIFRLAYRGGDITSPESYEFSVIDKNFAGARVWSVVNIANIDDDPELEVLYASSRPYGADLLNPDATGPIVVLDFVGSAGDVCDGVLAVEQVDAVIDGFKLAQNYPNPFNPTTTITIEIPSDEFVTVTIYNMLGHEVATLVNQNLSSGAYQVTWDGKNSSGSAVPAGTYMYQLKAGNTIKIRKMSYIK